MGKLLTYGLSAVMLGGVVGAVIVAPMVSRISYQISPDEFRTQQEAAVVRKYEGSASLDQILANHGFQIRYSGINETHKPVAIVNASEALAKGCVTDGFARTEVCGEYGKIAEATAAYSPEYIQPNKWATPVVAILLGTAILGALGLYFLPPLKRKPIPAGHIGET